MLNVVDKFDRCRRRTGEYNALFRKKTEMAKL